MPETVVIALGGNAILQARQKGTFEEQLHNVKQACSNIAKLIAAGHQVVLTHGNGPQVGNILLQQEAAKLLAEPAPIDACVAQTQGLIGYMLQGALSEALATRGLGVPVVSLVTRVEVDPADPAFNNPTKPIGPFYTEATAVRVAREKGIIVREDGYRGWRRVVPSPQPNRILEADAIRALLSAGAVVVAAGGGGVPVAKASSGSGRSETKASFVGVEAVIDKDLAAERLAHDVGASVLMILTDVRGVALDFHGPEERYLETVTAAELRRLQTEKHFRAGSMGPKVEAALRFVEAGGSRAVIAHLSEPVAAMAGRAGTQVVGSDEPRRPGPRDGAGRP